LDKNIDSMLKEVHAYTSMLYSRHRKTGRVDLSKDFSIIGEGQGSAKCGNIIGSGFDDINDAYEFNIRQLGVDTRVVFSHMSNSDDRHPHRFTPPLRS